MSNYSKKQIRICRQSQKVWIWCLIQYNCYYIICKYTIKNGQAMHETELDIDLKVHENLFSKWYDSLINMDHLV